MARENLLNQLTTPIRQVNGHISPVLCVASSLNQAALFDVVNYDGEIRGALQYLLSDVALTHGAEMVEHFKHLELTER